MTTHQKCVGLFGCLFGHRMEHNYNESEKLNPFTYSGGILSGSMDTIRVIEAHKTIDQTYINSICRRCGMVVEKKEKGDMV